MFAQLIGDVSGFMYGKLLIAMLLGAGLWFTFRTGLIQFRLFAETLRVIREQPQKEGGVSSFHALMVSTASRVGTGNIIGVSTALCLGGFGSMFWMWTASFLGGATAFVESTLAQIYKKRGAHGSYGGPAYYIEEALGNRFVAILFAFALIATYGVGFNLLCSYNLQSTFIGYGFYDAASTPWIIGGVLAMLVGWCLFGGGRRVIRVASTMVPLMGVIYIAVAIGVTIYNMEALPGVFARIFAEAFDFDAIFGGFAGSCVMYGIKRGLYSNEAGVGSAPNAAASADVSHPVKQGLVQMFSVFIDTIVLCSATAFMCMTSGIEASAQIAGAPYVQQALTVTLGDGANFFITISMVLFAFTTLIGNLYYVDNCLAYINGRMPGTFFMTIYRCLACIVIFTGAGMSMGLLWDIADVTMGLMAIINLPAICILGQKALAALHDYEKQRAREVSPVFKGKDIDVYGTDYWN